MRNGVHAFPVVPSSWTPLPFDLTDFAMQYEDGDPDLALHILVSFASFFRSGRNAYCTYRFLRTHHLAEIAYLGATQKSINDCCRLMRQSGLWEWAGWTGEWLDLDNKTDLRLEVAFVLDLLTAQGKINRRRSPDDSGWQYQSVMG